VESLKAGFRLCKPKDAYKDKDLMLAGLPWGILQYQSLRIPVFFKREGKEELQPQHFVRVSAYCHLIETQENGAQAPYGVVLFADNYNVQIVPNHEYAKDTFRQGCACVTNWRRRLSKTQMTSQNGRRRAVQGMPPRRARNHAH